MKNFNRDNSSVGRGGYKKFAGKKSWSQNSGGNDFSQRPQMFGATCSECGEMCEVPFRPKGGRPIFCSACFKKDDSADFRKQEHRDFDRPSFGKKQMFEAVCAKCQNRCEVPFQPRDGRPVYCSQCFSNTDMPVKNTEPTKDQFKTLNEKLDLILKKLSTCVCTNVEKVKEEVVEVAIQKPKKATKKITEKKTVKIKPSKK